MQLLTGIDQSDYSKIETGKRYYTFFHIARQKIRIPVWVSVSFLANNLAELVEGVGRF